MSELEALIAQVLQPGFAGTVVPDWVRRRLGDGLGSVILFGSNVDTPAQVRALTDALRAENPDVFVAVDEEAGDITRLEHATGSSYPGNLALGTLDDVVLTERLSHSVGARVLAAGIDVNYAPVADVNTEPRNPVIGARSFGSDPQLVARHVAAAVRGLHAAGVAACAKHFPGHGDTTIDSHHGLPTVHATRAELERNTIPPFRAAIDAGARAVMVAHLLLPALDPDHPASVSPAAIRGLLRTDLAFTGLAITDGIAMAAVKARYGLPGAATRALAAGIDLVCVDNNTTDADMRELTAAITTAVRNGSLPEARLAEAAARVSDFAAWRREIREAQQAPEHNAEAATGVPADRSQPAFALLRNKMEPATAMPAEAPASPSDVPEPALASALPQASDPSTPAPAVPTEVPEVPEPTLADALAPASDLSTPAPAMPFGMSATSGFPEPAPAIPADGLAAARQVVSVLRTEPGALPLRQAPHVVEAALPRSLATALSDLLPGTTCAALADLFPGTTCAALGDLTSPLGDPAPPPPGRPLVVAVRGIQRSAEDLDRVTALVKDRPDAIVVELGVPHTDPGGAAWVATYGISRVSLQAAAELLAGAVEEHE